MQTQLQKVKSILLYFCEHTDPRFLGKVKLMKLLYFLDFMHVKKYGIPVTSDRYVNLEHGPIPSAIKNLVDNLADDPDHSELADTIVIKHADGEMIQRITAARTLTDGDMAVFSPSELTILQEVCQRFGGMNTATIERASHDEAPWRLTSFLDTISYELAAEDPDCQVDKEEIQLANALSL